MKLTLMTIYEQTNEQSMSKGISSPRRRVWDGICFKSGKNKCYKANEKTVSNMHTIKGKANKKR